MPGPHPTAVSRDSERGGSFTVAAARPRPRTAREREVDDSRGPARIGAAFARAKHEGRAALLTYLMAGFPDESTALAAAEAAIDAGADLLEVGVPFSDPVADGPVIAAAGRTALAGGGGLDGAVRLVSALRERGHALPILVMSYLNPLAARGAPSALSTLADAGADGLIVPDLPAGEEPALERLAQQVGLGLCFLVAPNTTPVRLERAVRASTGFLYVVPLFGVTGAREELAERSVPLLHDVRAATAGRVPIVAGFGVSSAGHVAALGALADGVVVGSALVVALRDSGSNGPARVAALVRELAAGLPGARAG